MKNFLKNFKFEIILVILFLGLIVMLEYGSIIIILTSWLPFVLLQLGCDFDWE